MRISKLFLTIAMAMTGIAGPTPMLAQASQQEAADQGEVVEIPFKPPLGETLRYRVTTRESADKPEASFQMTVRFERTGGALTMTVLLAPDSVRAGDFQSSMPSDQMVGAMNLLQIPLTLQLSDGAEILGVANGEQYRSAISEALDAMAVTSGADGKPLPPEQKAFLKKLMDDIKSKPVEAQAAKLIGLATPIIEFAPTEVVVGELAEWQDEAEGLMGGSMTYDVSAVLERVEGGTAYFTMKSAASPESLRNYVTDVLASVPPGAITDQGDLTSAEITSKVQHEQFEVSLADGLVREYRSSEIMEGRGGSETFRKESRLSLARMN